MMRRGMDGYEIEESVRDRISELPDSLILQILSLLPMRDVVSTTFLSKRWENLWTAVPCLNFRKDKDGVERFRRFVDGALLYWEGPNIRKFEIETSFDKSFAGNMDLWVRFAVKHKVEELNIHLKYEYTDDWDDAVACSERDVYRAPRCINTCTSIKKLSLVGCGLPFHEPFTWDRLKSLNIDGFCFGEDIINQILSGSPCLEEFELHLLESYENLDIRSATLKKLRIEKFIYFETDEPSQDTMLSICCPNLEALEIFGCFYPNYRFIDVSSLTDATLNFDDTVHHELLGEALRQILPTLGDVENLALSVYFSEVLGASLRKQTLSPLPNVKFLKLIDYSSRDIAYGDVINTLSIFPNIKTLVIEDFPFVASVDPQHLEADLPESCLTQLKMIQIKSNLSSPSICMIIEFLFSHASMLENVMILPSRMYPQMFLLELAKKLSMLPRSSPSAKVIIRGGFHFVGPRNIW